MKPIEVWAPEAERVEVEMQGRRTRMQRAAGGWWRLAGLPAGSDYAFVIDGRGPFPDPRSPQQPHGVHGPSRRVDHHAFAWSDEGFVPPPLGDGVVYELHIGTFSPPGTCDGVIERLDHLVELGVTHVELMPVASFSGQRNWGYDGVALFAPHEGYGGPDGLKRLVDACHRRGLAVVLDVVYNHLGPEGNYLSQFGPYFTDAYRTPWGDAVNLDGPGSDEVRRLLCDNACMWLEDYRFDGLRIDAIHGFFDRSAKHLLEQLAERVDRLEQELGRPKVLIAESDLNDPRVIAPVERGGYAIDAQWSDDFHHALHALLTGEDAGYYADFGRLSQLEKSLRRGFVYDGGYSRHRQRSHGRPLPFAGSVGHQLLGYIQTHDQVGNRARGERIGQLVGPEGARLAAALVLTAPFVPMLFQGEEIDATTPFFYFTDHQDRELGEAVKRGRREEFAAFGWDRAAIPDPQAPETFARSVIDWRDADSPRGRAMLAFYRQLIAYRRRTPALRDGRLDRVEIRCDEEQRWLVMRRGPVHVGVNFADVPRVLPLPEGSRRIAGSPPDAPLPELPPRGVAVLEHGP